MKSFIQWLLRPFYHQCQTCGKWELKSKGITYVKKAFCSSNCFSVYLRTLSLEELLEQEQLDQQQNDRNRKRVI